MLISSWIRRLPFWINCKSWKHRTLVNGRLEDHHSRRFAQIAQMISLAPEPLEARSLLSALNIVFDYTYDTNNFFDTQEKKDLMDQAASVFEQRFIDDLAAVQVDVSFLHPGTNQNISLDNFSVPADTVIIFVGGMDLSGPLGLGGPGQAPYDASDFVKSRGQSGVLAETATDFAPWGGRVSFTMNPAVKWHFGSTTDGLDADEHDFLSVAVHEISHVLGFTNGASSFRALSAGATFLTSGSFVGPKSMVEYDFGGPIPLGNNQEVGNDNSHWATDVTDGGAIPVMGPFLPKGTRRFFTELDYAAMDDLGWTLTNTTPQIVISPLTGLITTEAGGSNTFSVLLTRQPVSNVTIALNSSNVAEGTASTSQLTFTPTNWFVPQTVTVTGVDDAAADNDQSFSILLGPAVSIDSRFSGFDPPDVPVINRDDEFPLGVNSAPTDLSLTSATVAENGPVGTTVGTINVVDSDVGDVFSVALVPGVGGTDNAAFRIVGNTLVTNTTFDFEEKSSYRVRLRVTDRLGATFEKSFAIGIANINEAPSLDLNGRAISGQDFGASFLVGGTSVPIVEPQELKIADIDSTQVSSARITIANLQDAAAESLSVNSFGGITANYDPVTGTLTLTGIASLNEYQNVLRTAKYGNSASNPNSEPRQISFTVTDAGGATSAAATSTVEFVSAASFPTFVFANGIGGLGPYDEARDVVIDSDGNVIVVGAFHDTVDFDPGPGIANLTAIDFDIYVAKYSPSGDLLWAKSVGGPFSDNARRIGVDGLDNIYFTGSLFGSLDFDPGSGESKLTSNGANDVFLAKWSADGDFLWAKSFGGRQSEFADGLAVDAVGNAYVAGSFPGTVDFDPGPGSATLTSAGDSDAFVAKFDGSGNLQWAKRVGGSGYDSAEDVSVDETGRLLLGGYFTGSVDFDPGSGTANLSSGKGFLLQLTDAGTFQWAKSVNGVLQGVALDGAGNALAIGFFSGTVDFDPGAGTTSLTAVGSSDYFLWKLNSSGAFDWVRQFDNSDFYDIDMDSAGSVYTTGTFNSPADLDPSSSVFNLTSQAEGGGGAFVSKLTSNGDFAWAVSVVGRPNAVAVDDPGNVVTVGYFGRDSSGTVTEDFDPGSGTFTFTSISGRDGFVSKLRQSTNQPPTDIELTRSRVAKTAVIGTPVGNLVATDRGDGNNFTYALVSGEGADDNSAFALVGQELRTAISFGSSTKSQFHVRVRATDYGGLSVEKSLVVMLSTINEEPQHFALSNDRVLETATAGTLVGKFTTTDPVAGDTFTYSLVSGVGATGNAAFAIVGDELRTAAPLNFDTQATYQIRVRSTDAGGLSVDKEITIHVTNVNAPPTLVNDRNIDIFRGETVTITSADLLATDPDNSPEQVLFQINGSTLGTPRGQLELNGLSLGYLDTFTQDDINNGRLVYRHFGGNNTGDSVPFRVLDVAGGTVPGSHSILMEVLASQRPVVDLNGAAAGVDNSATFTPGSGPVAIVDAEGLTVTDLDTSTLNSATIWLNNGRDVSKETLAVDTSGTPLVQVFSSLDDGRAVLNLSGTAATSVYQQVLRTLTYDNTASSPDRHPRRITVQVNDGGTKSKEATSTVLFPNRPPSDLSLSATSVIENAPLGSVVGTFSTSDPDFENSFTYSLVSGVGGDGNSAFLISGSSLLTNTAFHFETQSAYSIRVRSTDQGGLSFERTFTINVIQPSRFAITLTSAPGTEGNAGDSSFIFTVSRFGDSSNLVSVDFAVTGTGDHPADAVDFGGTSLFGTVTFAAGQNSKTLTISVSGDSTIEDDETFAVNLSNPSAGATISTSTATSTITNDDVAGFSITRSTPVLIVNESGTTAEFSVRLTAQPLSNVVLRLVNSDPTAAFVSTSELTFTPANWNVAQTVTVTGVDDLLVDGTQSSMVTVSVFEAASDKKFDGVADQDISVVTTDDDSFFGFRILETDGPTIVSESGSTDTFRVVLAAQPTSNVVLNLTRSDTTEAALNKTTLTFTPSNWNVPQTVIVTGLDDDFVDGSQVSSITIKVNASSSESRFDNFPAQTVSVTTIDNDVAGLRVVESSGSTSVNESGTTDTFTVVLTARPLSNVVLSVASSNTAEVTASPATLTFTNSNWNRPQTVTVRGVNDEMVDGDQTSLMTISVDDTKSDNAFDDLAEQTITVTTVDNDISDFGDAPESYSTNSPNGARHLFSPTGPKLGAQWDGEVDGQPSSDASADGADEDGVFFAVSLFRRTSQAVASSVFVTASKAAKLDAWIDFNQDGDFNDNSERIATGKSVAAGLNLVTFNIPTTAVLGDTFARFRISSAGVSSPAGSVSDGEVEDYAVKIVDGEVARRLTVDLPSGASAIAVAAVSSNLEVKAGSALITRVPTNRVTSLEINGSAGNDRVTLSALPSSLSGHVTLNGAAGNDSLNGTAATVEVLLDGGSGKDTLLGGASDDTLLGRDGDDSLKGNAGDDILLGGDGKDTLFGDAGDDALIGDAGNDSLDGGSEKDTLLGLDGNDTLKGGNGNDIALGGDGDDSVNGGAGTDTLVGNAGSNRFDISGERNELFTFDIHQILDRL